MYRLYTEGRDNDQDQAWNEDPTGSTAVSANFTHQYDFFGDATGLYPMSAPETKGVADFLIAHPNIAAVYVLGPQDNLAHPVEAHGRQGARREGRGDAARAGRTPASSRPTSPSSRRWPPASRRRPGSKTGPASAPLSGDPLSWAYYDMGRWAFGSRVWWIPDTTATDTTATDSLASKQEARAEANAYRWIAANGGAGFVAWKRIDHPDFPGREVEVGGFAPFVGINPPAAMLDSLARGQLAFVTELAGALPRITFRNVPGHGGREPDVPDRGRARQRGVLPHPLGDRREGVLAEAGSAGARPGEGRDRRRPGGGAGRTDPRLGRVGEIPLGGGGRRRLDGDDHGIEPGRGVRVRTCHAALRRRP